MKYQKKKLTHTSIKKMPMHPLLYLFLVDGEKGGVGKSTFARVLAQWMLDNQRPVVGVECDRSNPSFIIYYEKLMQFIKAFFTEDSKKAWSADYLIEAVVEYISHVIADLPAQTFRAQIAYLKGGGFRAAQKERIKFVKFFLCTEWYSVEQFIDSVKEFGFEADHILVLNEGLCDDFSFVSEHQELQEIIATQDIPIVRLPELPYREREIIKAMRMPYSQALECRELTIVGKQRVHNFLDECYEQLDQLGLFDNEATAN